MASKGHRNVQSTTIDTIAAETVFPCDTDLNRNPITFNIRPVPGMAIQTKNIKLALKFTVKKQVDNVWVDIESADRITLLNGPGFSLFEDCHLSIGGTVCETASREYSRTSLIRNMLFTDERTQNSLESALYFQDNPLFRNSVLKSKDTNRGEAIRSEMIENGKTVAVITPVYMDIFLSDCLLPSHVDMVLRFYPTRSVNCLLQQEGSETLKAKVIISSAELYVPRCHTKNGVAKTIKVNYECTRVLNYLSPKTLMSFSKSLNVTKIPQKIAMVILTEGQYQGLEHFSGHYFHHNNVKNITVQCNGKIFPSLSGMNMDPSLKHYNEPYNALFEQLHAICPNIGLTNFDNGNSIYGISLEGATNSSKYGTCDISVSFSEAPSNNLVILLFCYYNSSFTIDKNGIFHTDMSPKLQ